jgi:hypothetical protein
LSDKEVAVFVMNLMMRKFENLKVYINGKFNSVERRIYGFKKGELTFYRVG